MSRIYLEFLKINRWIYDPTRGIPIDTRNPQKTYDSEKKRLTDEELEDMERKRDRRSTADSSTHRGAHSTPVSSRRSSRAATSVRLQEKILAKRDEAQSDDEGSDDEEDEKEEISDAKLLSVYDMHKNTGRSGATPWKTIRDALGKKLTPHKLKSRINKLLKESPKTASTPKATKSKRSAPVVKIDDDEDDDDGSSNDIYDARFKELESQITKVTQLWSTATAENNKIKKENKSLQDDNYKLNTSLKKGNLNIFNFY